MRALQECHAILRVTLARRIDRAIKIMGLMGLLLTLGAIAAAGIMIWRHQMSVGLGLRMLAGVAALATQLLHHALLVWAMLTATILLVSFLVVGVSAGLIYLAGLCCLAGQVALTGVLGNYAGDDTRSLARMLLAGLLALFEAGIAFGAGRLTHTTFGWCMIAIAVAVTALQLRHGWRRMLAAPPAFPARRLALS
jgi:hypothetical protein